MKAIRFHALGGPEVLQLESVPDPVAGPGEVLLRVRAAGLNYADTMFRKGQYFVRPVFPQIPGMEAAGEILAVGDGVTEYKPGDRVMALGANAYAEMLVCKPRDLYPMPDELDFPEAAALPVQGLTAHHILKLMGRLGAGERVLIHAAAGGVGTLAIQLAKHFGASQVIGTAGGEKKLQLGLSLGADAMIDYRTDDVLARVKDVTAGKGVDVLLEMLGGTEVYKRNLACLAPMGRMVVYGAASNETRGTIEPIGLMAKNHTVSGYYLTPLLRERSLCAPALAEVASLVGSGKLRVVLGNQYALSAAAEAHRALESRDSMGKLVLIP